MGAAGRQPGGIIHTYRKYDPQRFPLPDAAAPDLVSPAFEHLLAYGSLKHLTPEELAEAVELDPRQIAGLGPSLEGLRALLEERKRRILETYETQAVRRAAEAAYRAQAERMQPPPALRGRLEAALRSEQLVDLERLWYRVEQRSAFARQLVQLRQRLADRDEIEELASAYEFRGRTELSIPRALEIKEELETIDRLLRQLEEAARHAKLYVIDLEALARYAEEGQLDELRAIQERIADLLRRQAEAQGLLGPDGRLELTPKAYRLFQGRLLDQIFNGLAAAKTGRHAVAVSGDGSVELQRTRAYEFGDSLAHMDVAGSLLNALLRDTAERTGPAPAGRPGSVPAAGPGAAAHRPAGGAPPRIRLKPGDIEVHLTRNTPKCATCVLMDMSGSMRWGGLYIHVKRMALALHGLIRAEYPGDALEFVEVATVARRRHVSEIVTLLPKPVTIHEPVVRLRADLSDPEVSETLLPPHFTNLQHGLRLARQLLGAQDTPNRQAILITDGLPTAHFEDAQLYMLYPPSERTAEQTLREGLLCREQGIVINIFLLSTWAQGPEDVRFAHRLAEHTSGRVFFVAGGELERFVVWDYVRRRRTIIG